MQDSNEKDAYRFDQTSKLSLFSNKKEEETKEESVKENKKNKFKTNINNIISDIAADKVKSK